MDPKPAQKPHIPLIIGGFSEAAMRRCARYGSGWPGFGLNPEHSRPLIGMIEKALSEEGRSINDFEIIITPASITPDEIKIYEDMGVDRIVPLLVNPEPDAAARRFDELQSLQAALSK
ncbi:MAG: hypothetical protein CMQ40_07695 [Gammaproteobacteria bacterium]|nr:hypothetical protein [Gammaproteobacteria bacterium]